MQWVARCRCCDHWWLYIMVATGGSGVHRSLVSHQRWHSQGDLHSSPNHWSFIGAMEKMLIFCIKHQGIQKNCWWITHLSHLSNFTYHSNSGGLNSNQMMQPSIPAIITFKIFCFNSFTVQGISIYLYDLHSTPCRCPVSMIQYTTIVSPQSSWLNSRHGMCF